MTSMEYFVTQELKEQEKTASLNTILAETYSRLEKEVSDINSFITSPCEEQQYLRTKLLIVLHHFISKIALRSRSNLVRLFSETGVINKTGFELCDIENDLVLKLFGSTPLIIKEPECRREAYVMTTVNNFLTSILRKKQPFTLSIDTTVGEDSDTTLGEIIPDTSADSPEEAYIKKSSLDQAKAIFKDRLYALNSKNSSYVISYLSCVLGIAPRTVVYDINKKGFDNVFRSYIKKAEQEYGICLDGITVKEKNDFNREKAFICAVEKASAHILKHISFADTNLLLQAVQESVKLSLCNTQSKSRQMLQLAAKAFTSIALSKTADSSFTDSVSTALAKAYLEGSQADSVKSFSKFFSVFLGSVKDAEKHICDIMADKIAHQRSYTLTF